MTATPGQIGDHPSPRTCWRRLAIASALLVALCGCVAPGGVDRFLQDPASRASEVILADGALQGVAAPGGKAWLGVPYAQPPIGALRWRAPRPALPWTGVRSARKLGHDCVQNLSPGALLGQPGGLFVRGAEDCLVLNVYAPSNATAGQGWPVMVWLHGGGFSAGTAANYDPSVLVQKQGVIVVTLNYRLGAFGFLAHPALSEEEPATGSGDYGLLDQQAALAWIGRNIEAFGGDPARVTLFGESAGGFSVCHQLTSPRAAHLFTGAIIESGACVARAQNEPLAEAEAAGERLAEDLGCRDPSTTAACLRAAPAGRIARTVSHRLGALGPNSWGAVVGTPVLPTPAAEAMAAGAFAPVPVMLGVNHDEGRLFAILQQATGRLWTEASYRAVLRRAYGERASDLEAQYPIRRFGSPAAAYAALITGEVFACPAKEAARLLSRRTPIWLYLFDDADAPTTIPHLPGMTALAAGHATEIAYILQRPWILSDPKSFTPAQRTLSDEMQNAWGRFARSGAPVAGGDASWAPYPAIRRFAPAGAAALPDLWAATACAAP